MIYNLGVKRYLDSLLFDSIFSGDYGCIYDMYRDKFSSVYKYSTNMSVKYQVLSEFTAFVLKEENQEEEIQSRLQQSSDRAP